MKSGQQDALYILLAVLAMCSFLGVQVYSGVVMSQHKDFWNNTDFNSTETDINPPGWAFSIWFLIYLWQFAWLTYVLTTLCRTTGDGSPVYQQLNVVGKPLLVVYTLNQLLGLTFFFTVLLEPDNTLYSMLSVFSLWVTVMLCLVLYHTKMAAVPTRVSQNLRADIICLVVLVQNGLAIYASWLTLADMLVLNSFVVYYIGVPMLNASMVTLTLLSLLVVLYFTLELTAWKDYTRYTLTTYPTLMWGLTAATIERWDPDSPVAIYELVLLIVVSVMFFVKLGLTFGGQRASDKLKTYKTLDIYY